LLKQGAIVDAHDNNGETPHSIAHDSENDIMLSMLTEYEN